MNKSENKFVKFFQPIDLTQGSVFKTLIKFALPIFISLFLVEIYGVIDSTMYGHLLKTTQIQGISNANASMYIFINLASGFTLGLSVVSSHAIGAGKIDKTRRSMVVQIILCAIFSVIVTAIFLPLIGPMLNFTGAGNSAISVIRDEVVNNATLYLIIVTSCFIVECFYYLFLNFLRSIGERIFPLAYVAGMLVLAISINLLFVKGFNMGVIGVALSKFVAEAIMVIIATIFIMIKHKELRVKRDDFRISFKFIRTHLKLSLPLAFNYAIIGVGLIFVQKTMNGFGQYAIIAYNYSSKYNDFFLTTFNAIGATIVAFAGQNYGHGDYDRVKQGFKYALEIGIVLAFAWMIVGIFTSQDALYLNIFLSQDNLSRLSKDKDFTYYAYTYSFISFALYPLLATTVVSRNFLEGIKRPIFPFFSGIGETGVRIFAALALPVLINGQNPISRESFIGLSAGQPGAWLASSLIMVIPIIILFTSGMLKEELSLIQAKNNKRLEEAAQLESKEAEPVETTNE